MTQPVIIITGALRGLGAAAARKAATLGAHVALLARSHHQLESVAAEILSSGRQALAIQADVSQPGDCERAVDEIIAANGQLRPPEKLALSLAWLALNEPHEWSDEFISWDDLRLAEVNATLSKD